MNLPTVMFTATQRSRHGWCLIVFLLAISLQAVQPSPVSSVASPSTHTKEPCGSLNDCKEKNATEVCFMDSDNACIRKYPSECHLKITACRMKFAIPEYNNDICSMESYYCEIGYERWTIFFGHENDA